ncbi:MAG TPA: hypothetical protein VH475_16835 [Tepidisphaeraceae bacterium]|jgi:hypothetical protein
MSDNTRRRHRADPADLFQSLESRIHLAYSSSFTAQFAGGGNFDPAAVTTDQLGNVYVMGHFNGVVDFNPARSKILNRDSALGSIFVAKFSSIGQLFWAGQFGKFDTVANSMAVDADGSVYVGGAFTGATDFDPDPNLTSNLTPAGGADAFLLKITTTGQLAWANKVGGTANESVAGVTVDGPGYAYLAGTSAGGTKTAFLSKFSAKGKSIAADTFGNGSANTDLTAITADASGNVYLAGSVSAGGVDLDPSPTAAHALAAAGRLIFKLTPDNAYAWADPFAASGIDFTRLATDGAANLYAAGKYSGAADFNPSSRKAYAITSAGGTDAFVLNLTSGGSFAFARSIGSAGNETADELAVDPARGDLLVTGRFQGKTYFNPGFSAYRLYSAGGDDAFLARYSSAGVFQEAAQFGNADNDGAAHLAVGTTSSVFLAGSLSGSLAIDFDPGPVRHRLANSNPGDTDGYFVKLLLA